MNPTQIDHIASTLLRNAGPNAAVQQTHEGTAGDGQFQMTFQIVRATRDPRRLIADLPSPITTYSPPNNNAHGERYILLTRGGTGILLRHVTATVGGDGDNDAIVHVKLIAGRLGKRKLLTALRAELQARAIDDAVQLLVPLDVDDIAAVLPAVAARLSQRFSGKQRQALADDLTTAVQRTHTTSG